MTALLASVRSLGEARRACAAGVDVVDCKDPQRGALGALSPHLIRAVARELGDQVYTSAAAGELAADSAALSATVLPIAHSGIDFVKVGLAQGSDVRDWAGALGRLSARGVRVVAVLFADRHPALDVLPALSTAGVTGVMLDTADKTRGSLRKHMSSAELLQFVDRAKHSGLLTGLAGSLTAADIDELLALAPDYLGFRGALCAAEGRNGELDGDTARRIRKMIPRSPTPALFQRRTRRRL